MNDILVKIPNTIINKKKVTAIKVLSRYCAIYVWEDYGRLDFEVFMNLILMNLERIKFSKMLEKWVNCPITFTSFYVTMSLVGWNCNIYNHPKNSKCGPFVKITTFLLADILLLYFNNKACLYKDFFRFKRAQKKYNQIGQRKNIIESTKAVLLYLLYYRKSETFKDLYGVENY